jgi:hypothetical protein
MTEPTHDQPAALSFLRHTLATLAYRGGKAIRDAPPTFADFKVGPTSRTPLEILAHVGDLLDWGTSIAVGKEAWTPAQPDAWPTQVDRFFAGLARFDEVLASGEAAATAERLFQGPIADSFSHVGQIALLRRLVDSPVRGENYSRADIVAGRVGSEQSAPRREFD